MGASIYIAPSHQTRVQLIQVSQTKPSISQPHRCRSLISSKISTFAQLVQVLTTLSAIAAPFPYQKLSYTFKLFFQYPLYLPVWNLALPQTSLQQQLWFIIPYSWARLGAKVYLPKSSSELSFSCPQLPWPPTVVAIHLVCFWNFADSLTIS